jgi:hypothetical protein
MSNTSDPQSQPVYEWWRRRRFLCEGPAYDSWGFAVYRRTRDEIAPTMQSFYHFLDTHVYLTDGSRGHFVEVKE